MSPKAWRSISALFFLRVECNAGFLVGYFNLLFIFKKDLRFAQSTSTLGPSAPGRTERLSS